MSDYVINVKNVDKIYKLYDSNKARVADTLGLTRKKNYREHYALKNMSFQVKKGECVGLIGTNGSGKSTILKIITGVLSPTKGEVEVDGRISALLELGAGFNQEYTGIENIYLNGTMLGYTKEEIDEKLDDILSFADIGDFVFQPVKTYSSGMFVRLAFAVAINIDPEILIVDEALSVGDVFFQAKCYKKFEEFKAAGKTILFVSHDLGAISKYCDRAVLINKGDKVAEGTPKEMIDIYNHRIHPATGIELILQRCIFIEIIPGQKTRQLIPLGGLNDHTLLIERNDPLYTGDDLFRHVVRLFDKVCRPLFQGLDLCGLLGCQNDDGDVFIDYILLHFFHHGKTVHHRHHQIQKHQRKQRSLLLDDGHGFFPVLGIQDIIMLFQDPPEDLAIDFFVIHHQNITFDI